jgi:Sulfatase-modifying factor enzyme 1/Oxidoreductase molybdopterin binding domain
VSKNSWIRVSFQSAGIQEAALAVARFPATTREYGEFIQAGGYRIRKLWSDAGWRWLQSIGFTQPAYWGQPGYGEPNLPVTGVSFFEAEAFAKFREARLPTDFEWFMLASDGGQRRFPWGNDANHLRARANLRFFQGAQPTFRTPVDRFKKGVSRQGVWDLLGNVSEWCHRDSFLAKRDAHLAVLRGGCNWHSPHIVDNYFRDLVVKSMRDNQTGIRLVKGEVLDQGSLLPDWSPGSSMNKHIIAERPTKPFRQEGIPDNLDEKTWCLKLRGKVSFEVELTLEMLRTQLPAVTKRGVFLCVCRWGAINEVKGVRLHDVVQLAQPTLPLDNTFVTQKSVAGPDGHIYESTIPLGQALDDDAILAYELDGQPLSMDLGWPLRLINFNLYGYKQVKCLGELVFTDEFKPGWWEMEKQYDINGVIRPGPVVIVR